MLTKADIEKSEQLKRKLDYLLSYTLNSEEDCIAALNYSEECNFAICWLYTTNKLIPKPSAFTVWLRKVEKDLMKKANKALSEKEQKGKTK